MSKFGPKNSKLPRLTENRHTDYLDDVDSYSNITFLSFQPKILFWTNLGRKIQKLFILTENRHRWYIENADSYSDNRFLNCQPYMYFWGKFRLKRSKLFVLPEIWHTRSCTHNISKMLILVSILVFLNFKRKSWGCWFLFWDILRMWL